MASGSLGHLAATVSLDIDPFKSSARALNAQIKATGSALRAQEFAIKGYGSSLNGMKAAYGSMGQQMKNYEAQLARQKKTYQDLKGQTASTAEEQAKLTTRQANAANQYNRTSARMEALRGKMNATERQITLQGNSWYQTGQKMTTFGGNVTKVGRGLSSVGGTLTRSVTAPLVGVGVAAVKTAVDFDHQMHRVQSISDAIGGQFKAMKSEAVDLGAKTQFSAREAADGMEELASAGFKPREIMKSMPGILDLAAVSGGNVKESAQAAGSALRAFGMSASQSGHLADVYAKAAADTNAETQDMAEAMKYAAPVAHSMGMSLEDTAASIGIMSDAGIKGSQAGTTLRGAMTRLAKPTKAAQGVMDKLGVSFFDASGKMKPMGSIIGELGTSMKGYDKKTKAAMLTTLFGQQSLSGMMALVDAGPDKFNKLSSGLEHSDGAAKKMAKTMNDDAAGSIESMMGSLESAGIKIGDALAPAIIDITKDVSRLVDSFTNLNPKTQEMIVKFGLAAAAAGPLMSILGKVVSLGGGAFTVFGKVASGIGRMQAAAQLGGTGLQILKSGFSQSAYSATTFAGQTAATTGALTGVRGAATSAASGLSLLNPAVLGVTAAIVGGVAVWELWGKKALESSKISGRWGADVGASADKALGQFQKSSSGITSALTDMDSATSTSTKSMSKAFESEFGNIEQSAHTHMKNVKETIKGLDPEVAGAVEKAAQKTKSTSDKLIADAKQHETAAQNILKGHNKSVADLSDDQRVMLKNHQDAMANDELRALNITGKKKKAVMATLNQDYDKMSQTQRDNQIRNLDEVARTTTKSMAKQQRALKKALDDGKINQQEYNAGMKELGNKTSAVMDKTAAQYIKLEKASGKSTATIKQDMLEQGLSYQNGMKYIEQHGQKVKNNAKLVIDESGKMSKATKKAVDTWNDLVFDEKTGKLKTNAQEEINKAVKSGKKWDQIKLLAKKGKLTTNAKEMVAKAAISQGKWDGMTWKEQKALIRSEGGKDLVKLLQDSGEWNDLTVKQKTALVNAKGQKEIADLLMKTGVWNDLTVEEKNLVLKDSGTKKLYDMLNKVGTWNKLTVKEKTAVIAGDDKGIANMLVRTKQWNGLTLKQQQAYVATKGGKELSSSLSKIGVWNSLTPKQQVAIMTAKGKTEMVNALVTAGVWNQLTLSQKEARVTSKGTVDLIDQLNKMGQWNSLPSEAKNAIVHAKGSADLGNIITKYGLWKQIPASTVKQMVARDKASGNAKAATDAVNNYNKAHPNHKIFAGNSSSVVNASNQSTKAVDKHNGKPVNTKKLPGDSRSIVNAAMNSTNAQSKHNNKKVNTKHLNGDPSSILKSSSQSTGAQDRHNSHRIDTKHLNGDPSSILNASSRSTSAQSRHNSKHVANKHLPGTDDTSSPANRAISAISRFNGMKETVKHFKSVYTTVRNTVHNIFSHKKKARGTSNFEGGNMLVNDQPGSVYQEMVKFPHQKPFMPVGRNVLIPDAPKGTKVLRANLTAQLSRGLTRFAEGSVQTNRAVETILNTPSSAERNSGSVSFQNDNSDVVASLEEQTSLYRQQITLMNRLIDVATSEGSTSSDREMVRGLSEQFNKFDSQRNRGRLTT